MACFAADDNKLDLWCLIDNVCKRVGGRYVQAVEAQPGCIPLHRPHSSAATANHYLTASCLNSLFLYFSSPYCFLRRIMLQTFFFHDH